MLYYKKKIKGQQIFDYNGKCLFMMFLSLSGKNKNSPIRPQSDGFFFHLEIYDI